MTQALKPRPISLSDVLGWIPATAGLILRLPLTFGLIALLTLSLPYLAGHYGIPRGTVVLIYVLIQTLVIVYAYAADENRRVTPGEVLCLVWQARATLGTLLLAAGSIYLLFSSVAHILRDTEWGELSHAAAHVRIIAELPPFFWLLFWSHNNATDVVALAFAMFGLGFVLPLAIFHTASPAVGFRLSWSAFLLNAIPLHAIVIFYMAISELPLYVQLAPAILGLATLLTAPFSLLLGVFLYVAYRHIFLGRSGNTPIPKPVREAQPTPA